MWLTCSVLAAEALHRQSLKAFRCISKSPTSVHSLYVLIGMLPVSRYEYADSRCP